MSMSCWFHPERESLFWCQSCSESFCEECAESSSCRNCGGQLAPADQRPEPGAGKPLPTPRGSSAPDAASFLTYPLRGLGIYLFFGYVGLVTVAPWIPLFGWFVSIVLALMIPGFLFAIVRSTTNGDDHLPDWPELDIWDRLRDAFAALLLTLLAWAPMVLAGVFLLEFENGSPRPDFIALMALAIAGIAGFFYWIPAFGAVAVYESGWLALKFDGHVRAVVAGSKDLMTTAGILALILFLRLLLPFFFNAIPLIGSVLESAVDFYGGILAAHLIGLFFRRHVAEMDSIYLR